MDVRYAVVFGVIAMIGSGLSGVLARGPVRTLGSDRALVWRGIVMVALLIPLLAAFFPDPVSWQGIAMAVGVGLIGYLPIFFFYRAISYGRVGVISPISNSYAVITALLAVAVLGESFGPFRIAGLLVVLSGVVLLSVDIRDWKRSALFRRESGLPYAVAACLLWGGVMFLFRYPVHRVGPILTSVIVETVVLLFAMMRLRASGQPLTLPAGFRVPMMAVGFFGVIGVVTYNLGLMTSAVAVVAILNMTNPVVAAAYERLVHKESLSARQYVGMALAIVGAVMVSAG